MLISVIIPHLNQHSQLAACLASLHQQDPIPADIEIIVVDNGSARLPKAECAAWPEVRLVQEATPGPGPARNRGIADARGALLAFIDADCLAGNGWLAAIHAAFEDPSTQVIGGDVRVGYADPARPTFIEPYESIYSYRNNEHIREGFSGTGNLAMRRPVFDAVGPFAGLEVAEDRDWGLRAKAAGYQTRYVPKMIIYHPARRDFEELTRKWDRHVAHDFERVKTPVDQARWLLKSLAMVVSPLAEIGTIIRSDRVNGPWERLLALACLVRVRWYRSRRMLAVAILRDARALSGSWNRD